MTLKPFLIMQGALDTNMLPAFRPNSFKAIGRRAVPVTTSIFEGCEHEWVAQPGPQTDRAHEMAKNFIAQQVNA